MITVLEQDLTVRYSSPKTERILGYPIGWRHPDGVLGIIHPGAGPQRRTPSLS